jgi:aryl-alcohol dehydrogenase-like predicted oxidoreductase
MNKRVLGRTGIKVSELALGGLFISKHGSEFDDAKAAVKRAVDLGINYVDTAPTYSNSEEVLGRILSDIDAPLIVSTKLGGRPQPFEPRNKDCLRRSFDESLRLLNRKHIDLLMIHEPDRSGQYDWWSDVDNFTGPVQEFLDDLKRQGLVKFIGLGGTTAYEMPRIIATDRFDVVLTAFNYSLLWREAELEVLPAAARHEMGIIIGSPLQQGALSKRYDDAVNHGAPWLSTPRRSQFKALYRFLDECGIPIAEMGMRFVVSNPGISCVLTGARSAREVEANVAAVEKGPLPPDVLKRLDEIARMVPFRPYEEPFSLPFHSTHPNRVGIA